MPTFSLSIHADYGCRHSGACCTTPWDIPVELSVYRTVSDAISAGRVRAAGGLITTPPLPPGASAVVRRAPSGACVFFESETHLCEIHRELGEDALPGACRHFPRLALTDLRGTSITLSHYCPTAAGLLFRDDVPLAIVANPRAFPTGEYEGLTAVEGWPPLLRPRVLMDLDAYGAWERHAVQLLASTATPETALATLARDVEWLRGWQPGAHALADTIGSVSGTFVHTPVAETLATAELLYEEVVQCVPAELRPPAPPDGVRHAWRALVQPAWANFRIPINRYLAGHAFGSWCAYQGRGLRTWLRGVDAALAVLMVESARQCMDAGAPLDRDRLLDAIRSSDLVLRHLASPEMLARQWSRAEDR